ncbi:MAG: hypothetical protein ABI609_12215 [Acidobacteriota bacterium]
MVFNPGERVFGETEPGVALLLGALRVVTRVPIPWLGALLTLGGLLAIASLLLRESTARGRWLEAAGAGTLVVSCAYLWDAQGAAAPLVVALLLAAAAVADRRPWLAGVLCGAAVWCRPDAVVGVGLLGLLLWNEQRRFPWRIAVTVAASAIVGAVAAQAYYGAFIPGTLHAKQLHAARNPAVWIGTEAFWGTATRWFAPAWGPAAGWLLALGCIGLVPLWRGSGRGVKLLVLNGLALFVAYPLLRVPFFPWYGIPCLLALMYGVAASIRSLWRASWLPRRVAQGAAALVLATGLASVGAGTVDWWESGRERNWRLQIYGDAGKYLREHSAPEDAVAFPEIGVLAFTSDRPVEDLLGLVTPRSLPFAREGDVEGAFLASPAPFMLEHSREGQGAFTPIVRRDWFRVAYEPAARFDYSGGNYLVIYRRLPGASIPPPRLPRPRVVPPDPIPKSG